MHISEYAYFITHLPAYILFPPYANVRRITAIRLIVASFAVSH